MSAIAAAPTASLSWYLVRTKPASESMAGGHLERQGFAVYFPCLLTRARRSGRLVEAVRPLFPRYLFVGLRNGLQSLGSIGFTRGVSGIVRFGAELASVPFGVIERLRARADPDSGMHHLAGSRLERGTRVQVIAGAFEGLEGIFQSECGDQRVVVLLDVLGQSARVRLGAADVTPLVRWQAC